MKKILLLLVLPLALAGCSSTITNLTPGHAIRNPDGTYRVEAAWRTTEHAIRAETLAPKVMIGMDFYPMRPELTVHDRWEAFVPVPADQKLLHYRFKFDFTRDVIPSPVEDSRLSGEYTLHILDKTGEGK